MSQEDAWLFDQPLHVILRLSLPVAEVVALDWLYEFIHHAITKTDLCVATLHNGRIRKIEPFLPQHIILSLAKIFLREFPAKKPRTPEALSKALQSFTGIREDEIQRHADHLLRTILFHVRSGQYIIFTDHLGEPHRLVDSRIPFAALQPDILQS